MKKIILLLFVYGVLAQPHAFAQFNVNISTAPTVNMPVTNAGTVRTFTANATGANLQIADIIAAYTGGVTEVRILTNATGGIEDGNITFGNPIDYNTIGLGKTLTLIANNTINITQNITDGTAGGDLLNLNFTGNGLGASVTTVAGVQMNVTIATNGGNITLVGTQNDAGAKGVNIPGGNITTAGGFLSITGTANGANAGMNTCDGIDIQSATTTTAGGAITLIGTSANATGNNGVQIDSPLNSGAGAITITGISNGNAVGVVNTVGSITTTSGNVTITGTANSTVLANILSGGVVITQAITTGSGKITIVGESNSVAPAFVNPAAGLGTLTSTSGDISITGTAKNALSMGINAHGVLVQKALNTGTGKITITGENNGSAASGIIISATLITTGGDITLKGNTKNSFGSNGISVTQPINAGTGKITITGDSNGTTSVISLTNTLTTTGGDITINGLSKNPSGGGLGISIGQPINAGTGKISITSETNGFDAVDVNTTLTTTGGDITLNGNAKNTFGGFGVVVRQPINAGTGKINITGESNGNLANGIAINGSLTTTNADITLTGKAKGNVNNSSGIRINNTITTGTGNLIANGESNSEVGYGILSITFPISTNGDIILTGINKNTTSTPLLAGGGIIIGQAITTGAKKITITGESNSLTNAIIINSTLTTTGGDITLNGVAKNTTGGSGALINNAINSGAGKITITGESNGVSDATIIQSTLTTTSGNIEVTGNAKATTGGARGINVSIPITTGSGNIKLNGESSNSFPGLGVFASVTSTSGSIELGGINKSTTSLNSPFGVEVQQPVSTGGNGTITIIGESNGNGQAVITSTSGSLTTTNGDISITGIAKSSDATQTNTFGVLISQPINAATGKITITGESNGISSAVSIQNTLTTTSGNIEMTGKLKATTGFGRGIEIFTAILTGTGNVILNGESGSFFPAIATFNTITTSGGGVTLNGKATNPISNPSTELPIGVEIQQPINTGAGKITIIGENNGGVPPVFIWTNGNLTTTSGNVEISGKAKSTVGSSRGVDIRNPITTGSGNVTITGESESEFPGASLLSNIISTSGSFFIKGINNNVITNSTVPYGVETNGIISTGGNGTISIEGENNANARATLIFPIANISTVNGNINIKGTGKSTNNTYVNAIGVDIQGLVNVTGTGSISVTGESNANSLALAVFSPTTTLRTNSGDINITGLSKSTVGTLSRAVEILSPLESVSGKINIIGESRGLASAINTTFSLINPKDISLLSRRGNINIGNNRFIQSTNGGRIDICVPPSYNLVISGAVSGNSIQTTAGAPISITNGGTLAVGNAANLIGLISNGTNTVPAGTYQTATFGAITIFSAITSTFSAPLAESTLNNATVTLKTGGCASTNWANTLSAVNFGLTNYPIGTSIKSVRRIDNATAEITLAFDGTDFDANIANAQIVILTNAFNPAIPQNLLVSTPITAEQEGIKVFDGTTLITNNGTAFNVGSTLEGTPITKNLRAFNDDINAITISGFTISGGFALGVAAPITIAGGASVNIPVVLTGLGNQTGKLNIISNSPVASQSPFVVNLTGSITPVLPPMITGKAGSQSVTLSWESLFYAGSYEIYGYALGQPQQLLGTTTDNKFVVTGLKNATNYFFRVIVIATNDVRSTFSNTVELRPSIVLGTEDESLNSLLSIYPNPSEGTFTISLEEKKVSKGSLQILIYDLAGKIQYQESQSKFNGIYQKTFEEKSLNSGMYLIQLQTEQGVYSKKIIIK